VFVPGFYDAGISGGHVHLPELLEEVVVAPQDFHHPPRSSGMTLSFLIITPSIMSLSLFQTDLALVPDHEPVGQGLGRAFIDAHLAADQAFVDPASDINDLAASSTMLCSISVLTIRQFFWMEVNGPM